MKEGKFDGLLVDYVLGELEPEVEALVESYLEVELSAKVRCEETRALLGLVERVDGDVFVRERSKRSKRVLRVVLGIGVAALVAVGCWVSIDREAAVGDAEVAQAVVNEVVEVERGGGGFWSISERQKRRVGAGKKRRLVWESLTRAPKVERTRL